MKEFLKNKKYLIIIGLVILILLIFLIIYIYNNKIELVDNPDIVIASKYELGNYKINETKENYSVDGLKGKVIFLRGNKTSANIFQVIIDKEDFINGIPILIQIDQYIKGFENSLLGELDIPLDAYTMDSLYNEKDEKLSLTNEEEIYSNNNQYTRIYKYKDIYYDFNYYMFNDNLYCEIVRFL